MQKVIFVGVVSLIVALLAGCSGADAPAEVAPQIIAPNTGASGDISLIGTQTWQVIGDTVERPVELTCLQNNAISLARIEPGLWTATALSSWQADVALMVEGQEISRVHVITTRIRYEMFEVFVDGATAIDSHDFDGGVVNVGQTKRFTLSWIDHGNAGYPGTPGPPYVSVVWVSPEGVRLDDLGDDFKRDIGVTPLKSGVYQLKANICGYDIRINFVSPD